MRNGKILNRKFFQFLLPTALSVMAMSLNEFVDGLLVANLIDSDAMTLVNMAAPLMNVFAVIYTLLGVGGSTIYAGCLGRHETDKADKVFSVTMLVASFIALLTMLFGFIFIGPLSRCMCGAVEYQAVFEDYLRAIIMSGVLIIPIQVIISFTPALGCPGKGTFLNITANVVNLIMDYVYIRLFDMGLTGAAFATLSGYAVGLIIIVLLCLRRKIRLPFTRIKLRDIKLLAEAASVGLPPATNQVGYCIKIAFTNALAFSLAGMAGTTVFSVCMQAVSMVSVFIGGVINAVIPIASSLYGQRDFSGMKMLMRTAIWIQFIINLLILLIFELWPQGILAMYNVTGDIVPLAKTGLRIFSIMFLFRGFVLIYIFYFPVIGRKIYAFVISTIDGFLGLIPLALILTKTNGINGLWWAYALLSIMLLLAVLMINLVISVRSRRKYSILLLLEHEDENVPVYECTLKMRSENISRLAEEIQDFCVGKGVDTTLSALTAVSVEEMSVYSSEQSETHKIDFLDILLKIYPEHILIDFRSIGSPFDISATSEKYSNMEILRRIVTDMDYNYVLGMNQTRLICKAASDDQ